MHASYDITRAPKADRPPDILKILVVTPSLPYPPSWGFGIRVYQIIRHLAKRHHVTVVAYAGSYDHDRVAGLRELGAFVEPVIRDRPPTVAKRGAQLLSILSPSSFQRRSLDAALMQSSLDRILATDDFDVIQVESSQMSAFDFGQNTPVVVDEHNIEYELLYRTFKMERAPLRKVFNWVEFQKFRREERQTWKAANGCVLTSSREEGILRKFATDVPTCVVPNGVDVEFFRSTQVPADPNNVVFVGVMHYRPYVDAAMYFAQQILPLIRRHRPSAKFTIVGGGAPDDLRRLAGANVVLTEEVPDTRPHVDSSGVFVVPLRMGSGTRLKVLEGLAMSRAVVSTSLGCEGINVRHGEHLLVADDPQDFARAVLHLMDDRALAAKLGRNGRALVESRYSWSSVLEDLESFLLSRCGRSASNVAPGG